MRLALLTASLVMFVTTGFGRQANPSVPSGPATGRIAGVVVDGRNQPVRSAIVKLTGAELPLGRAAITDDTGTFSLDQLPAGRFSLTSSKAAYLTAAYGAVRPGGTGTPIVLTAGQQLPGIKVTMPRGGAVAGVIRDSNGAPIPALQVAVIRSNAGVTPAIRPETVNTDDRGAYRFFGLAPGAYIIYADRQFSGGIGEIGHMSTAEVDAALARLKNRGAGNPGAGNPATTTEKSPSSIVRPTSTLTTSPVFFPGVASVSAAAPVTLGLEEVREGLDFVYQLVRTVSVSGTISGADGQNVQIGLNAQGSFQNPLFFGGGPMLQRRSSSGDGEFVFTSVTPGKYTLTAQTAVTAPGRAGAPAAPASQKLFASTTIDVIGDDMPGIALVLQPMPSVSGRVVFVGTPPPSSATAALTIRLVPVGALSSGTGVIVSAGMPSPVSGLIRPDGTFQIAGVLPGAYRLATARDPAGWTPATALLAERDLLDLPLEVGTGDVTGIDVRFTDQHTTMTGRLLQADGTPATGYFVVAFTTNKAGWLPQSRRLKSVRPGTDGGFRFGDLPAGEYFLAALTDADSEEWQNREFLERVTAAAVRFTLGQGERKSQDLRIGK